MIQFYYQNKLYDTSDLDKKLKKMGITRNDIVIREVQEQKYEDNGIVKYKFKNVKTNEVIVSICDTLNHLKHVVNIDDYIKIQ